MIRLICNYGGVLLAFLSITATAYFARRYSEKKLPRFCTATERKIARSKDAPDDIAVTYKGKNVDRICSTLVWFWNAGRKPIKREDLPASQPLEIRLKGKDEFMEILDVAVPKTSREAIGFKAQECGKDSISVDFDFMDHNDGAVVEILHSGSIETEATFSGIILGAPKGVRRIGRREKSRPYLFPYPIRAYARRGRPSLSFRIGFSAVITLLLGGFAFFLLSTRGDITTTEGLLMSHLKDYVARQDLQNAVDSVISNSKYRTAQPILAYVMSGILFLNIIVGYIVAWRSPFTFPLSLVLGEPRTEKDIDAGGEAQNAEQRHAH